MREGGEPDGQHAFRVRPTQSWSAKAGRGGAGRLAARAAALRPNSSTFRQAPYLAAAALRELQSGCARSRGEL